MEKDLKVLVESLKILSESETEILSKAVKTVDDLKELKTINSLRDELLNNLFTNYKVIPLSQKNDSKVNDEIVEKTEELLKPYENYDTQIIEIEGQKFKVAKTVPKNLQLPEAIKKLNSKSSREPLDTFFKYSNIESNPTNKKESRYNTSTETTFEEIIDIKSPINKENIELWHQQYKIVIALIITTLKKIVQEKSLNKEIINESTAPKSQDEFTKIIGKSIQISPNSYIYQTEKDAIAQENKFKPYYDSTKERIIMGVTIKYKSNLITITAINEDYNRKIFDLLNKGGRIESVLVALKDSFINFDGEQNLPIEEINIKSEGFYNIKDIVQNDFKERGIKK